MARIRIFLVLVLALTAGGAFAYGTYRYIQSVPARAESLPVLGAASVDDVIATVPREYYGGDLALYRGSLMKNKEGYSPDARFTMEGAQNVHKVLNAFVPEVQKAKIDLAQTFDNSYADRALKKYGGKK